MHPLVRDLYKRVIHVGKDYPLGLDYVRKTWKAALRNPQNCPACYTDPKSRECEQQLRKAVGRGRHMVNEMIGIIQLKKYRTMKRRYGTTLSENAELEQKLQNLARQQEQGTPSDDDDDDDANNAK
jgi:hypothetical protein